MAAANFVLITNDGLMEAVLFFVKQYFPVRIFWFLIEASVQYVTTSVVSLPTIRQLGLLNNQQAIEITKEK